MSITERQLEVLSKILTRHKQCLEAESVAVAEYQNHFNLKEEELWPVKAGYRKAAVEGVINEVEHWLEIVRESTQIGSSN